ncbi:MAG: T7SS effector LXG polymorphic toxin [Oscillospiraceae bacterium]
MIDTAFLVKYDDITSTWFHANSKISGWTGQLDQVANQLKSFIEMKPFEGAGADSVKSYLSDVHYTILISIGELFNEYKSRFLLYKDGYNQSIDSDLHFELCENTFNELISFFPQSQGQFNDENANLVGTANTISDIMGVNVPNSFDVDDCYFTVFQRTKELKDKTGTYELEHVRNDFTNLEKMLYALKEYIAEYMANDNNSVANYQSGNTTKSYKFLNLYKALQDTATQRDELSDQLKVAGKNESERLTVLEKEWADQRAKDGAWKWVAGAGAVIVGTVAIVCTAGAATPIVVVAVVAGTSSIAYGASNMYEAGQEIKYGLVGDAYTAAWNPLRDTIFMGNHQVYDVWGNTSTFVAGAIIPVGVGYQAAKTAGTSISRAIGVEFTKDIVSAGSGYVAGQVGTHYGTEWFGPDAGKWIGLGSGLVAGFGTSAGLNRIDNAFNVNGAHSFNVNDVLDSARQTQRSIIDSVDGGGIKLETNMQKGNYGEMKMDDYFESQGYERISTDRVTDLNGSTHQGIDGVYLNPGPPPKYIVAEAKYGSSKLGYTKDGKQMSDTWIETRLENAVGENMADDILLNGYDKVLTNILTDGEIITKSLDSIGNAPK